jgi:hypothetical protein
MQKKKPSFQVIPNYSINGATNWNESKEVPAEHGCNDIGLRSFSERCRPFCTRDRIAKLSRAASAPGLNCTVLTRKWCGATVWLAESWPGQGSPVH